MRLQPSLENNCGSQSVDFVFSGAFLTVPNKPIFGLKAGQSFVVEFDGHAEMLAYLDAEGASGTRRRSFGAIHVQRKADNNERDTASVQAAGDLGKILGRRASFDGPDRQRGRD